MEPEDFEDQLANAASATQYITTAVGDLVNRMPEGRPRRLTERAAGLLDSVVELLKLAREEMAEDDNDEICAAHMADVAREAGR